MKKQSMLFFIVSVFYTSISNQTAFAQNTSPFWSLAGNSTATPASKLGTTNDVSLRFYTNDLQRMIINSASGHVGIGIESPVNILTVKSSGGIPATSWLSGLSSPVFMGFAEGVSSEFVLAAANSAPSRRAIVQGRRSRGTLNAPAVVVNNDYITSFLASAYDGSAFVNPATIDFFVDGVPSAGKVPARISLVTGSNADDRVERLKVGSTGNFNFNNTQLTIQQSTGNVGIGIGAASAKLQLNVSGADAYQGLAITNTNKGGRTLTINQGAPGTLNFTSPGSVDLVTMNFTNQNVGIGTTSPGYKLDVAGRMRIRDGGGSAGTWLMNAANTSDAAFIGMKDDNYVGLWGNNGLGWGVVMNTANGNVGIGTLNPGGYKTKITHSNLAGFDIENAASSDDWELFVFDSKLQLFCNSFIRGQFNCTTGAYTTVSDERLKTNIKPMTSMLQKINQLKPSTYQFKAAPDQEHNGFIAQEVMKIFPDLVSRTVNSERKLDTYTLDYAGFGVLAIKGIQELQVALEDKDQQVKELKNELDDLKNLLISKGIVTKSELNAGTPGRPLSKASLAQSIPNPSNGIITLGYSLPNDAQKASIQITSINGTILKSYPIAQTGNGQVTVNSRDFAAGIYIYTLMVNGNKFESKKMIITR